MRCKYIDNCKYYDDESETCQGLNDFEYCGNYRTKQDIEEKIKYNRKVIK